MNKVTLSLIKELRKRTGISIANCKKILIEMNGNVELAIESMRQSGKIKEKEKSNNITNNGVVFTKISSNCGFIIEVNCETDFASKDEVFRSFAKKVLETAILEKTTEINVLNKKLEEERVALINKINENVIIRRISSLKGKILSTYQHHYNSRIGVIIAVNKETPEKLVKKLAMHIAACKPKFITPENIPSEIIEQEKQIQFNIAVRSKKSKDVIDKIVKNRITEFIKEISFTSQPFIMNPSKTIYEVLKEYDTSVTGFICFEVGENFERK